MKHFALLVFFFANVASAYPLHKPHHHPAPVDDDQRFQQLQDDEEKRKEAADQAQAEARQVQLDNAYVEQFVNERGLRRTSAINYRTGYFTVAPNYLCQADIGERWQERENATNMCVYGVVAHVTCHNGVQGMDPWDATTDEHGTDIDKVDSNWPCFRHHGRWSY